jgi:hypothetical protein
MTDLAALIAKLDAVQGPSRELDAEIAALCAPTDDPRLAAFESGDDYPRNYTRSLDAALSLLGPPGYPLWTMTLELRAHGDKYGTTAMCEVTIPSSEFRSCHARSPAIAVCIAALKARRRER